MGIFKQEHFGYIGIDIGAYSIKAVELELVQAVPRLRTYGMAAQSKNIVKSNALPDIDFVKNALQQVLKKGNFASRKVITALPNIAIFQTVVALPKMPEKEMHRAVMESAKKVVPMSLDTVSLDWRIVAETKTVAGTFSTVEGAIPKTQDIVRVVITAAPKGVVERYVNILKSLKLDVVGVETQATSLIRALIGNDQTGVIVVDVGHETADVMLVQQRVATITRSVDVGGDQITRYIQQTMGLEAGVAEQFKKDLSVVADTNGMVEVPAFLPKLLQPLLNEVEFLLREGPMTGLGVPEKIVITGGSALLPGFSELLKQKFHLPVFLGDPWARMSYPADLKMTLQELGPAFSTAIGCAMREFV